MQRLELAERLGLLTPGRRLSEFAEPRTALEERLSCTFGPTCWASPGSASTTTSSLLAAIPSRPRRCCRGWAAELQIELPANALFHSPTVAELAAVITRQLATQGGDRTPPIPRRNANEPCPLSFAQQRLWVLDQLEPGNPAYNMHVALRLSGRLSAEALEQSLSEILRRHEALRTTFRTIDGQPAQVVSPAHPLHVPMVDLTRLVGSRSPGGGSASGVR